MSRIPKSRIKWVAFAFFAFVGLVLFLLVLFPQLNVHHRGGVAFDVTLHGGGRALGFRHDGVGVDWDGGIPRMYTYIPDGPAWGRSAYSLKQIALAIRNYAECNGGRLPRAVTRDKTGQPLHSWRVQILPFLDRDIRKLKLDEPWNSPHNKNLLQNELIPERSYYISKPYRPYLGGEEDPWMTRYQVFVGPGTIFERDGLTLDDIPDGGANTILVVEAADPVPWSKPVDIIYSPDAPLPPLGGAYTKPIKNWLGRVIDRKPAFVAAFADGSTRLITSDTDEKVIRSLITRNGGEQIDWSKVK